MGAGLLCDPVQMPSERHPRSGRDTHGWDAAGSGTADSRRHTRSQGPLEAVRSLPVPAHGERSTVAMADVHLRARLHAGNGLLNDMTEHSADAQLGARAQAHTGSEVRTRAAGVRCFNRKRAHRSPPDPCCTPGATDLSQGPLQPGPSKPAAAVPPHLVPVQVRAGGGSWNAGGRSAAGVGSSVGSWGGGGLASRGPCHSHPSCWAWNFCLQLQVLVRAPLPFPGFCERLVLGARGSAPSGHLPVPAALQPPPGSLMWAWDSLCPHRGL